MKVHENPSWHSQKNHLHNYIAANSNKANSPGLIRTISYQRNMQISVIPHTRANIIDTTNQTTVTIHNPHPRNREPKYKNSINPVSHNVKQHPHCNGSKALTQTKQKSHPSPPNYHKFQKTSHDKLQPQNQTHHSASGHQISNKIESKINRKLKHPNHHYHYKSIVATLLLQFHNIKNTNYYTSHCTKIISTIETYAALKHTTTRDVTHNTITQIHQQCIGNHMTNQIVNLKLANIAKAYPYLRNNTYIQTSNH
eukprot:gene3508-2459_t